MKIFIYNYNYIQFLLPYIFLIWSAIFLLIYGTIYSHSKFYKYPLMYKEIFFMSFGVCFLFLFLLNNISDFNLILFNQSIILSYFEIFIFNLLTFCMILILIFSYSYIIMERINSYEYSILILFLLFSCFIIISANDLLILYEGIEMQNLIIYCLICIKKTSQISVTAGLKYFILATILSSIFLFLCSILFGIVGNINYTIISSFIFQLAQIIKFNILFNNILILIICLLIIFFFKLTLAPFHFWAFDIYEGAPIIITAIMMIISKIVFYFLFIKFFLIIFFPFFLYYQPIILITALISICIGNFGGVSQLKMKKLLTYSSINHIGYILLGLGIGTFESLYFSIFYLCCYIMMIMLFFIIILSIKKINSNYFVEYVSDLYSLKTNNIYFAYSFSLLLFSMAGIPPLLGFFAKFFLLLTIVSIKFYLLIFLLLILNLISTFYYLRIIKLMFFGTIKKYTLIICTDIGKTILLSILVSILFIFFFYNNFIINLLYKLLINFYNIYIYI